MSLYATEGLLAPLPHNQPAALQTAWLVGKRRRRGNLCYLIDVSDSAPTSARSEASEAARALLRRRARPVRLINRLKPLDVWAGREGPALLGARALAIPPTCAQNNTINRLAIAARNGNIKEKISHGNSPMSSGNDD